VNGAIYISDLVFKSNELNKYLITDPLHSWYKNLCCHTHTPMYAEDYLLILFTINFIRCLQHLPVDILQCPYKNSVKMNACSNALSCIGSVCEKKCKLIIICLQYRRVCTDCRMCITKLEMLLVSTVVGTRCSAVGGGQEQ